MIGFSPRARKGFFDVTKASRIRMFRYVASMQPGSIVVVSGRDTVAGCAHAVGTHPPRCSPFSAEEQREHAPHLARGATRTGGPRRIRTTPSRSRAQFATSPRPPARSPRAPRAASRARPARAAAPPRRRARRRSATPATAAGTRPRHRSPTAVQRRAPPTGPRPSTRRSDRRARRPARTRPSPGRVGHEHPVLALGDEPEPVVDRAPQLGRQQQHGLARAERLQRRQGQLAPEPAAARGRGDGDPAEPAGRRRTRSTAAVPSIAPSSSATSSTPSGEARPACAPSAPAAGARTRRS